MDAMKWALRFEPGDCFAIVMVAERLIYGWDGRGSIPSEIVSRRAYMFMLPKKYNVAKLCNFFQDAQDDLFELDRGSWTKVQDGLNKLGEVTD